jgi:peptidoglycan/LPS O-acetylase OafA/YrhL
MGAGTDAATLRRRLEKKAGAPSANFTFQHFPQLDGLRGLAIILVLAGHMLEFNFGIHSDFGGLGVLLFFLLSGFLITGILNQEKSQTGGISLSSFYVRRGLRLFPALFAFLATLCLLIQRGVVTDTPWYTVAACLLYVRNIWGRGSTTGHIWSLSLEEQFYTIWPWIMKVFDRAIVLQAAFFGAAAISVFRTVAIQAEWFEYGNGTFYLRPWFRFDSILLGCGMALLLCDSPKIDRYRAYFSGSLIPLVVWPSLLAWSIWGESLSHVWYLTIQMALAAPILLNLVLSKESRYFLTFSHPIGAWAGRLSYSLYLWQQLFTIFKYPQAGGLRVFPLNIVASIALAGISYFVIEKPFLKLKDRFGYRDRPLPPILSGTVTAPLL